MSSAREEANARQREAADPGASAFVAASAGAGKTKLLTDRLLRLMLGGAHPSRLLCLTFTRAAAAEMATRLSRRLGAWAVADDAELDRELSALQGAPADEALRTRARQLFATVLELPGGMRIATLHAFAQSLLRGFPLEAGLPPGFAVLEEMDARAELAAVREAVLPGLPETPLLAALTDARGLGQLVHDIRQSAPRLRAALQDGGVAGLGARLSAALDIPQGMDEAALDREAVDGLDGPALSRAAAALTLSGAKGDVARGEAMRAFLALDLSGRLAKLPRWERVFLTTEDTVRADKNLATQKTGAMRDFCIEAMAREGRRLLGLRGLRQALALRDATLAAMALGQPVLEGFAAAKARIGRLDYEDLIQSARALLEDPGAAWVLFKLDGGLDHLLLDEAQDSNPEQWEIAAALSREFFAGEGQERPAPGPRTVFAVGDVKQSIFGFQGADAEGLPREARRFAAAARGAGQRFREVPLSVSFRSAPPVLALVDAVFAEGPARQGVVPEGETLRHLPDRAGAAGRVELWPLLHADQAEEPPAWAVPETPSAEAGPDARLAAALAARIAWMVGRERLEARGRLVRPGDVLVLVRRRNAFVAQLIRALKERGVPVGGRDRMVLIEQLPVQDVLATLDSLLLPEDDLQLAAALKSPIFGLDEDDLFALAHGRTGPLAGRLLDRRGAQGRLGEAAALWAALVERADHLPPHALIAELLSERGARARMLARLGPDAADPLDELLNAALAHERAHPSSLQHFLHWLRRSGAEVKREPEGAGDQVRVMTVHGAKGLQAPVVILPDTVAGPRRATGLRWTAEGLPLWAPRQDGFAAEALAKTATDEAARTAAEENRLLYVALTRAEDWLLVCGWYKRQKPQGSWYDHVADGFARLAGAEETPFDPSDWGADATGFAPGPLRWLRSPQKDPVARAEAAAPTLPPPLPGWAREPAPEPRAPRMATPSHMEDEAADGAPAPPHAPGDPLGRRFRRGNLIHALLQSLPAMDPGARRPAGAAFLARPGHGLSAAQQAEILEEALAVLDHPGIATAFGPGSLAEAPLAGRVGERLIMGVVDRLLVAPDRILLLDFKTNRPPPATPEAAPAAYLRQMAAYRAVLRLAFPGRRVEAALVWTYGARVMPLPAALLDAHAPEGDRTGGRDGGSA